MKTLILCASPRKNGYTAKMVEYLAKAINAEIMYLFAKDFSPCIDCRYCHTNIGCVFEDDFSDFLEKLEQVDQFIIASPIQFGSLSGHLMSFFSRFQTYYANNYIRSNKINIRPKKVGLILSAGSSYPNVDLLAIGQYHYILGEINGTHTGKILLKRTDTLLEIPQKTLHELKEFIEKFK